MKKLITISLALVFAMSAMSLATAADASKETSSTLKTAVLKDTKPSGKHTGFQFGPSLALQYYGYGFDALYRMKNNFAVGANAGGGLYFAAEAYGRYYLGSDSWIIQPYVGVGLIYWEPVMANVIIDALGELFTGKNQNIKDFKFLGPSLKAGIDIPVWKFVLNVEGGGAAGWEIEYGGGGTLLAPTALASLKFHF